MENDTPPRLGLNPMGPLDCDQITLAYRADEFGLRLFAELQVSSNSRVKQSAFSTVKMSRKFHFNINQQKDSVKKYVLDRINKNSNEFF